MKDKLLVVYFFSKSIFFSVLSFFLINHDIEGSGFTIYNMILVFIILQVVFFNFVKKAFSFEKKFRLSKVNIIILLMILLTCLAYSYFYFNQSEIIAKIIKYFFGFTIPAIMLGLIMNNNDIDNLYKNIKILNIFITLCFCISLIRNYDPILGFSSISGASHLLIGYTMSALFPYNFIKLVHEKKMHVKLFYMGMIVANILIILASGSKGSLVSVALCLVIMLFMYAMKNKKIGRYIFLFFIVSIIVVLIFKRRNIDFQIVFWRISTLFNSNFEIASSGRDIFYTKALLDIKESPIFGNGIGYYAESMGAYIYPHNIILEVLVSFGFVGLFIFLIIMFIATRNIFWLLKQQRLSKHMLAFLFINVMVELMFSSSFLVHHQFWLGAVLILTLNKKQNNEVEDEKVNA